MISSQLKRKVFSLSELEKIELIEALQNSLDRPSPDVEEIWARESEARYMAYKDGKVEPIPMADVMSKYSL